MRVLGIDIGIKNLAYCIVDKVNGEYVIPEPIKVHWNIINIVKENVSCIIDDCENDVIRCTTINGNTYYFCGKHGRKEYKKLIDQYPMNKYLLEKEERCSYTKSCKSKASCKLNGTFLCNKHDKMVTKQLTKERAYREYKVIISEKYSMNDIKERLMLALDAHKDLFLSVNHVRIEAQPMFVSNKVKLVMDALASWFYIRGHIDTKINHSLIKSIEFSDSKNKLKISKNDIAIKEKIDNATNRYSETKKMGIEETKYILTGQTLALQHLNLFKKKDDLCDAYLHAVYGIQQVSKKLVKEKRHITVVTKRVELQRSYAIISALINNSMKSWRQI